MKESFFQKKNRFKKALNRVIFLFLKDYFELEFSTGF